MRTSIALFTRDLRVHDNPVLHAACAADAVIPLFVLDEKILGSSYNRPNRAAFLAECLADTDAALRERGGRLLVRRGDVADVVRELAEEHEAEVHVAADVSGYAHRREDALRERLDRLVVHDATITALAPGAVTPSGDKDHFAVFTPYHRRWAHANKRKVLDAPEKLRTPDGVRFEKLPGATEICQGDTARKRAKGGETEAWKLAEHWLDEGVTDYGQLHDEMAKDGTSRLSPYLHFGAISPIALVDRTDLRSSGGDAFVRQLAWRDFHHQVLAARQDASTRDYRSKQDRWRYDKQELRAWQEGRTGYPIVDAGMRQLLEEGWMHNRARLIVGSFLTKTLYMDWRLGAEYFLDHLVDGDLANNQLNWQWVAGTGTDSRPNRVLNPIIQAHRYDPEGNYVRRYLPELKDVSGGSVHEPWKLPDAQRSKLDYPEPIVDLREGADRFLTARGKN